MSHTRLSNVRSRKKSLTEKGAPELAPGASRLPRVHRVFRIGSRSWMFGLILAAGLLAACGVASATPTALQATRTQSSPTPAERISPSPQPTRTPTATDTPPPTETPPAAATETPAALHPTESPDQVRFAVIGDFGLQGPDLEAVATLVKSWQPDLIITTGDNNYLKGESETIDANIGQYFHEYIAPYKGEYGPGADRNRFFPTMGNHDWETAKGRAHRQYFNLPGNERYYDFVWGPVHFFALSSDSAEPDGVGRSSIQAEWLRAALADSESPWQIVFMHHPPYSSSRHGSTDWMQWPYKEWGVDAVLSGHDHVYERLIVDDLVYFTNGLGGNPNRYTFPIGIEGSQVRFRSEHGAMRVQATAETLLFEFFTVHNELIDSYMLSQAAAQQAPEPVFMTEFPDAAGYTWEPVADGFERALLLTHAGDGSGRLFVAEQSGLIWIVQDGVRRSEPFLDIRDRVFSEGYELGLLGLVFHPKFEQNGVFFVKYSDGSPATITARYQVAADDPDRADPDSEVVVLRIEHPFGNHNGGHLAFGADGFLYIAVGDGGSAGDPQGNGQNTGTLLGTILRLDVENGQPYAIPPGNPFSDGGGRAEIWHYGLRNPWRFTFDRATGDLYIADVGQNAWEEIDFWPAGLGGGANFGWNYLEGAHPFKGTPPQDLELIAPIWEYDHADRHCSVTGGAVYRGAAYPEWQGIYLYGDFCSGYVWGLLRDDGGQWQNSLLFDTSFLISSFGEDEAGELYVVDWRGAVYRLTMKP